MTEYARRLQCVAVAATLLLSLQALPRNVRAADVPPKPDHLSGAAWWHANQAKYPNSTKIEDLEPKFRAKSRHFLPP